MSVYWNTEVRGKLKLEGNWTNEAINAFLPVMEAWERDGDQGLWECGKLSESLRAEFTADFGSYDSSTYYSRQYGWYEFIDALESLDNLTRNWINYTKKTKKKVKHPLTAEQYDLLLKIMHENDLSISIKFNEIYYGEEENSETQNTGALTSNGKELIYKKLSSKLKIEAWKDYSKMALDSAVDFFMNFIEAADEEKVRKWVKKKIAPTDVFKDCEESGIDMHLYEGIVGQIFEEEVLRDFIDKFSPGTESWNEFFQMGKEEFGWFTDDESDFLEEGSDEDWEDYDDEDDFDDEDEEEEDEPGYPTEELDSLDFKGKRFVLTGEFQNCDGNRDEIKALIEAKGGKCTGAVSGKTNFLVLGDFGEAGAQKVQQALEQQKNRNDIKIITESTLYEFLE